MSGQPQQPPQPPPGSTSTSMVQWCAFIGAAIGIAAMWMWIGPTYFPPPEDQSFNWKRMLAAGGLAAVGALLGGGVGMGIDAAMRKK